MKRIFSTFLYWHSLLIIPIAYLLSFLIILMPSLFINETDLIPHKGRVTLLKSVNAVEKQARQKYGKGHSLILKIDTEPKRMFVLGTIPNSRYEKIILSKIKLGDTIIISTVPELFERKRINVSKIQKNKQIITPYYGDRYKKSGARFLSFIFLIFALLSIVYFLLLRRRYLKLTT